MAREETFSLSLALYFRVVVSAAAVVHSDARWREERGKTVGFFVLRCCDVYVKTLFLSPNIYRGD